MKKRMAILLTICLLVTAFCLPAAAQPQPAAGVVTTASTALNVRQSPSTGAAITGKLSKGSTVTLLRKNGDWWQVQCGANATGYCSAAYITPVSGSRVMTVATQSTALNVRTGAGTGYGVKATLPKGGTVVELSQSGGWSRVLYNGTATGYVSSGYLAAEGGSSDVTLAMPRYQQTDSRWRDVKLGGSNTTIGRSGCATCCLAMTESYRLGATKTPADLAGTLSYTAGGSVYWPANYTQSTHDSGYLTQLRVKLLEGKPVILGLKTAAGGTHFVVVTGCTGTGDSANSFAVHDPGAAGRNTLAQVLAAYPVFYKMLWYN